MNAVVVRLSDLAFLSPADLSGACSESEFGEKILKQFAFLPGDLRVTITDGTARIEYREPAAEKLNEAQRLFEQAAQSAKSGDFQQALHLFTQARAANPALPVARRDLAMLHYEARRDGEITFDVAQLRGSLSRRHKDTEKSSCPPRCRRPLCLVFSFQVSAFQHFPSCLIYAGFKRIAPEQDTGMDLNEPWTTALGLFNAGE